MYQKTVIVGNLGSEPELRYLNDGTAVTNFSVATNRRWKSGDGGDAEETTWFRISIWGAQAEACNQYLSRGRKVLIEGRLKPDPATGGPRLFQRQDGSMGAAFELTADAVRFLSERSAEDAEMPEPQTATV